MIFRPLEIAVLISMGLGGWGLILFAESHTGFALVLLAEAWTLGKVSRLLLLRPPDEAPTRRRDIFVLWALYLIEASSAVVWPFSHMNAIILLIGGEIATAAWSIERRLMPLDLHVE